MAQHIVTLILAVWSLLGPYLADRRARRRMNADAAAQEAVAHKTTVEASSLVTKGWQEQVSHLLAQAKELQSENQQLYRQNAQLLQRSGELQTRLAELERTNRDLRNDRGALRRELETLRETVTRRMDDIGEALARIEAQPQPVIEAELKIGSEGAVEPRRDSKGFSR